MADCPIRWSLPGVHLHRKWLGQSVIPTLDLMRLLFLHLVLLKLTSEAVIEVRCNDLNFEFVVLGQGKLKGLLYILLKCKKTSQQCHWINNAGDLVTKCILGLIL